VDYTLEQQADGSWKVVDVALDGESWVDSIRDQVVETLKKSKWTGLKKKLSDRLAELRTK
jgi:ABC-type transporter MlaC component